MKLLLFAKISILILIFSSCSKKTVTPIDDAHNDEEVITTARLELSNNSGGKTIITFKDLDGDGGNSPVITYSGDSLNTDSTYNAAIYMENEIESPAEDITAEIKTEDTDHQLFYIIDTTVLSISYLDKDSNGDPLGLSTKFVVKNTPGTYSLRVVLRHQPDKKGANVNKGDITNAGGSSDLDINLPIYIK